MSMRILTLRKKSITAQYLLVQPSPQDYHAVNFQTSLFWFFVSFRGSFRQFWNNLTTCKSLPFPPWKSLLKTYSA